VFAFSDVMHFFSHKLAGLRAGGFPLALRFFGSLDSFFLWHESPPLLIY
jgi:hypothetical protein